MKSPITKFIISSTISLFLAGCFANTHPASDSPTPQDAEISNITGEYAALAPTTAKELGLEATIESADQEHIVTMHLGAELQQAINQNLIAIKPSIVSQNGGVAAALPALHTTGLKFWLNEGFYLQCILFPNADYLGLSQGVGYRTVFKPEFKTNPKSEVIR